MTFGIQYQICLREEVVGYDQPTQRSCEPSERTLFGFPEGLQGHLQMIPNPRRRLDP